MLALYSESNIPQIEFLMMENLLSLSSIILSGGTDDRALSGNGVVPFISPASLEVQFRLPHRGIISGMLIPRGVTVITGLKCISGLQTLHL